MPTLLMTPGPTNVPDRVMAAMQRAMINHRSPTFHALYGNIQDKCRQVFQTRGEIVVLSASGTGGIQAAINNLLGTGQVALVPVFGEFSTRIADAVEATGARALRVPAPYGSVPPVDAVRAAAEQADRLDALVAVYNDTSPGSTLRYLRELSQISRKYDAYFVVDAISILGGDELPVDAFGVDICVTGSQKCLAAPPGLAVLSVSERAKAAITRRAATLDYFDLARYFEYAERSETPFTPALPLFFALDEALNLVLEEGLAARIARHRHCAAAFYDGFASLGVTAYARLEARSNTVIAMRYPEGVDDVRFRGLLADRFGVQIAGGFGELRGAIFRVGSMGIVHRTHVNTTIRAVASTLSMLGHRNDVSTALAAAEAHLRSL